MIDPPKTIRQKIEALPTQSYCAYVWAGAAIGPSGQVFPCCRYMGPHTDGDTNIPHIRDGLKSARESNYFTSIRKQMIEGKRPVGCKNCWNLEDTSLAEEDAGLHIVRSSLPRVQIDFKIKTRSTTITPDKIRYLETGISRLCNMACIMCGSSASSTIYSIHNPKEKIPKGFHESNDNIDDDLSELLYLKFVGGEPMLEHKHDSLLEKVIELNKDPSKLKIEYHTNASHFPSQRVIDCWKQIKNVKIIFSLDGIGENATLQRPGKYKWQDIEDTVDKYVELTKEVSITFSSNTVMTALNVWQITDITDWLYNKIGHCDLDWFNINPIFNTDGNKYINFRNLSKETKDRIKSKWNAWEDSNPSSLGNHKFARILEVARYHIDEEGNLGKHLTKELMMKNHSMSKQWKHFNEDLSNLDIEEK
tara:strand:+ start:1749 stop:3008 length:1260 start_codon:yes stop_codon:yes gene_type:complete